MYSCYKTFYFYPAYAEIMKVLPEERQDEYLIAIMTYGSEGTYSIHDPFTEACFQQCKASIDSSKKRYEESQKNGFRGGRPREINRDYVIRLCNKGLTVNQIAEIMNCHVRTIQRIIRWNKGLGDSLFDMRKKTNYRPRNTSRESLYLYGKEEYDPYNLW